jgi:hypothetical protein
MKAVHAGQYPAKTRDYWGCVVFQADEAMDEGPVWAYNIYPLPKESITKGYLYHFGHSPAAWKALDAALERVVRTAVEANFYTTKTLVDRDSMYDGVDYFTGENFHGCPVPPVDGPRLFTEEAVQASLHWAERLAPHADWAKFPVGHEGLSDYVPTCGQLANRPLIKPADRILNWEMWTAAKMKQFISAFDSQPGTTFIPNSSSSRKLYVFGAHVQSVAPPVHVWTHLGYGDWDQIPNGTAVAVRKGAVFFKTRYEPGADYGIWITHGRLLKPIGDPIEPKVPLETALMDGGHGEIMAKAVEWPLDWTAYRPGDWQEIYVNTVSHEHGVVQFIYWSF